MSDVRNWFLVLMITVFSACSFNGREAVFNSDTFQLSINKKGFVKGFIDSDKGINYLYGDSIAPLLSVRFKNIMYHPVSAKYNKDEAIMLLNYSNGVEAKIKVEQKKTHINFELIDISDSDSIELVTWGPFPTTINKVIGETVGVVQGEEYAIGIQSLNVKTLGGYPWKENDCMPQINIFEQDDYSDVSEKGKSYVLYRVEGAKPTKFGSTLQAYCRNRNRERVIENWSHDKYVAPAFDDGGVVGSKIALFGCPVEEALETIGEIEIAEGLPHPLIDGKWAKTNPDAAAAYLIMDFGESNIDEAIEVTKKAGLKYLDHPGPFRTWGNFELNGRKFPEGVESLKRCVEKAEEKGVMVGVHTLSNFLTPNDKYITPVPDKRLAKVGSSIIIENIDKEQTVIPIKNPVFFNQNKNNHMRTVHIGDELIRYGEVSEAEPWKLLDCQRGAFGTVAASHEINSNISKLADHGYKVFLTDPELSIEVSKNIAELYNKTGLRQISFDGLEGNRSTGMGNYGEILFAQTWYDNLNDEIKSHYIADASRTCHYFWHVYTRMNWGEPWYAGFRESQTTYRLKNQPYFKRNLMPAMLGWFQMKPTTSAEDIEWMLARSGAFDAGYCLVTSFRAIAENGSSDEILNLVKVWEKARLSGAFTDEQKKKMEDISNEFHLEETDDNKLSLHQVYSQKFKHEKKVRQPGEPLYSTFSFENPEFKQILNFNLTAVDCSINNIRMEIDNYKEVILPISLKQGETIKYKGGNKAVVYNMYWQKVKVIKIDESALTVSKGEHTLTFDCDFKGGKESVAKLELRVMGKAQEVNISRQ
jgi:hypothetical protein